MLPVADTIICHDACQQEAYTITFMRSYEKRLHQADSYSSDH